MTLVNHCPDCHISFSAKMGECPSCGSKFIPKQIFEGYTFPYFTKLFAFEKDGHLRFAYHVYQTKEAYEEAHQPECVKVRITVEVIEDV